MQKTRSTKTCRKGSFIIDDTVPPRRDKKTEGVEFQYSGTDDAIVNCNVVVFSVYADDRKHYPLDLRPYKPASEFLFGRYINSRGEEEIYYSYGFTGKVRHIGGPYRVVIVKLAKEQGGLFPVATIK